MTLTEITTALPAAFTKAQAANKKLEDAKAALAPLEAEADSANEELSTLMSQFQAATGATTTATPGKRSRRGGAKNPRTPEQNVIIQEKKARSIAEKAGLSKKEVEKAVHAAGEKSAKKAGIPYPLK